MLPHLDLLTTSVGGLTSEAREVIPLLYENPELCFMGFKDPSFPLPKVIENLFPRRESLLGVPRDRLAQLPGYPVDAATYAPCDFEREDPIDRLRAAGLSSPP